jgi:hypothetical protein
MKHLRECDYSYAYLTLCKQSRVELEHPLLSQLHSMLVVRGDFVATEAIVQQAAEDGYLDQYVRQQPVQAKWSPVKPTSEEKPGMRGGHQMCMDTERGLLYMFGGWDGSSDLSDLWQFTVQTLRWDCLSTDTSQEGGPSGRSCHKMCLDSGSQQLFLLGRYLSPSSRSPLSPTNIPVSLTPVLLSPSDACSFRETFSGTVLQTGCGSSFRLTHMHKEDRT